MLVPGGDVGVNGIDNQRNAADLHCSVQCMAHRVPQKECAKAAGSGTKINAKLRQKNCRSAACKVADLQTLGEIARKLGVDNLDRDEGEIAEDVVRCDRRDCHFGCGA